jgi:toxin ParE1/3/4
MEKVVWTESALLDLRAIHEYISTDSEFYANRFVDRLIDTVEGIQEFPRKGRVVPEFNNPDIREVIVGPYRVVYRIYSGFVGVVRIHHSSRPMKTI